MMQPLSLPLADWMPQPPQCREVDAVVIGSGYGGSVAALRLAEEGRRVVLLERGSEFLPGEFPNDIGQLPKFLRAQTALGPLGSASGLFDWRAGPGLVSLVANGLGGGSLINAGVMMRPDADVFAQSAWPAEIRLALDACSDDPARWLDAAFGRAAQHLGGELFRDADAAAGPVSALPKAQALDRLGERLRRSARLCPDAKAEPARVTIDLDKCTRCGDCFTGCNVEGAKRTLGTTYLRQAVEAGVQIVTRCLVYSIAPFFKHAEKRPAHDSTDIESEGWLLHVLATESSNHARSLRDSVEQKGHTLRAALVVIAAGTFGSTELLMRSRQRSGGVFNLSPALGSRLSANGDHLSVLADEREPVDGLGHGAQTLGVPAPAPVGPTITTLIDLRHPLALEDRVVIQEGAAPGALVRVYQELLASTWVLRHLGERWRTPRCAADADPLAATRALARHTQMLLSMGHDGSKGRIEWVPAADSVAPCWTKPQDLPTHVRQHELFQAVERRKGVPARGDGVHMDTPLWRTLPDHVAELAERPDFEPTLLTVHPLGGCPMGDSYEGGVVNHRGQVWRRPYQVWPDLYVLDGSIVPTSLGCNPMWTITALAERAMAYRAAAPEPRQVRAPEMPLSLPPREPQALRRPDPLTYDVQVTERLEKEKLDLRGALRRAFGVEKVECDLRVVMRHADWASVWDEPRHRFEDVSGTLRLVNPDQPEQGRLEYTVAGGHVELLAHEAPWPAAFEPLRRLWRCARVAATWRILRGPNDHRRPTFRRSMKVLRTGWHLAWQAAEVRHVRYDLRLERSLERGVVDPPDELRVHGGKWIGYAATWPEIVRYLWARWRQRALWADDRKEVHPGDLRASVLHQLTQPTLTLEVPGSWRTLLPAWLGRHTKAQFDFDQRDALQRSPVSLVGGGDSCGALLAVLAYPALIMRHLLLARLLEFRLPNYSRRPLLDVASAEDVALRAQIGVVVPEETTLRVRRGRSSSDDGTEAVEQLELRLWRYRRKDPINLAAAPPSTSEGTWCGHRVLRAKSVLLMHAFGMSGYSFTFKSTERNYAEHLYNEGWEVWILDSRMSPRTKAHVEPATLDQLGAIDVPETVEHILATLRNDLALPDDAPPLQISCFAQCVGSIAVQIALLSGRLSYLKAAGPQFAAATGQLPLMPKLAALVSSQTHPFIVGSRSAQSKTWVPAALRNLAARRLVPLAVRRPADSLVEATADRVFAAMPVPEGERCPAEGERSREHDDDCTTCRRIRFLDAELFKHCNLNEATHRELPKLFGDANVRLFAHAAKFVNYERLTSEDGFNVYATEEAIGLHLGLPIRFVHGALNQLFDKESATRSAEEYAHIHPAWAQTYGLQNQGGRAVCDVIEGYGHLDPLIGVEAMNAEEGADSVYDRLTQLLTTAWTNVDALPLASAQAAAQRVVRVSFPKAGPWFGPVVHADTGSTVDVAFVVDDGGPEATHTACLGASAIVGGRRVPLEIVEFPVPTQARDGFDPAALSDEQSIGLRVARGTIEIADDADLVIECISHSTCGAPPPQGGAASVKGGRKAQRDLARRLARTRSKGQNDPQLETGELFEAMQRAREHALEEQREVDRPFPQTLSQHRVRPENGMHATLRLDRRVVARVAPGEAVRVALGCCRYSGLGIDRERADEAFSCLESRWLDTVATPVHLLLMLGDQIYADASAGAVDPLSPFERYVHRHQQAFSTPALRALLARLPVVCLPDDHEFADAYPLGRPLFRGTAGRARYAQARESHARRSATQAVLAYQTMQLPGTMAREGWCSFERGAVRFFAFDTRRWRGVDAKGVVTAVSPDARWAFERWLTEGGSAALNCVLTASPLLPGRLPGANPANPGPPDTMQASPDERRSLLASLLRHARGRFVLITGDHHLSWAGEIRLDGETVGAAIVAPPFYAPLPFVNAMPHEIWLHEALHFPGLGTVTLAPLASDLLRRGSGYGVLSMQRRDAVWRIELEAEVRDFERGKPWHQREQWPAIDLPVVGQPQVVPGPSPATATVAYGARPLSTAL